MACKEKDYYIYILNNSDDTIFVQHSIDRYFYLKNDTFYDCEFSTYINDRLLPNERMEMPAHRGDYDWNEYFERATYIQYIMVSDSVVNNVPCDTIRKYNMILHRYQLTGEDLKRMDWVVTYPPE